MADPTEEELEVELVTQFESYLDEIKRLIKTGGSNVAHAVNSMRINGYSLADLLAIIRKEVKAHEDDPNNPHQETLAQLGGLTTVDFETQSGIYFSKDAIPISKIPSLGLTISGPRITMAAAEIIYMGRKLTVPLTTSGVMAPVNQYLKLTVTGKAPSRVLNYSLTGDPSEDISKFIVGSIVYANGVWTATPIPCVRIGAARLSPTPHGLAIPVSGGTQAAPGSLNPGWFN